MPAERSPRPDADTSLSGAPISAPASPRADRRGPVAGILLAAGTASRMGSNKLLFHLGGESLLRGAARRMLDGGLAPLLVVLGYQADRARQELDGLACRVVVNPGFEQGITSSLRAGLAALEALEASNELDSSDSSEPSEPGAPLEPVPAPAARIAAAMVLLADMPLVTADMIAALISRYRTTTAPLVISDYEGVQAPPMLYDRALFEELSRMTGGGKQVVKRHSGEAEIVGWPAAALADVDVAGDYARMTASMEAGG